MLINADLIKVMGYVMGHVVQSGGWPYSKISRDSSKVPSLRAAVLRAAVFV